MQYLQVAAKEQANRRTVGKAGLADLPVQMNPYDEVNSKPNFWLSCMCIEPEAMCRQVRGEREALYVHEAGRSCPTEILETLASLGVFILWFGWFGFNPGSQLAASGQVNREAISHVFLTTNMAAALSGPFDNLFLTCSQHPRLSVKA